MTFVDTSALYALADIRDKNHAVAKSRFQSLLTEGEELFLHNYIIVETIALLQHRLGFPVAEQFLHDLSHFSILWIDPRLHEEVSALFVSHKKRGLSFVDCASFVAMNQRAVKRAFAFDDDFITHGFSLT